MPILNISTNDLLRSMFMSSVAYAREMREQSNKNPGNKHWRRAWFVAMSDAACVRRILFRRRIKSL